MATSIFMYGSKTQVLTKEEFSKRCTDEIRFLGRVKGCTRMERIRKEHIRAELDISNLGERIKGYRIKWTNHAFSRMEDKRLPKIVRNWKPIWWWRNEKKGRSMKYVKSEQAN